MGSTKNLTKIPLLCAAFALLTSFSFAPSLPETLGTDSPMRVTRHVAGGLEYLMIGPPDGERGVVRPPPPSIYSRPYSRIL